MAFDLAVLGAAKINGTSGILLDGVQNQSLALGLNTLQMKADGELDPQFLATMSQAPTASLTIAKIAQALAVIDHDGLFLPSGAGAFTTLELFYKLKEKPGGEFQTGAVHKKLILNQGAIIPRTLNVPDDETATYDMDIIATADGVNDPFVLAESVALGGAGILDELFTLGPVKINGTTLEGVQNFSLDFGIEDVSFRADGDVFPKRVNIIARRPNLTITVADINQLFDLGLVGTNISADIVVFLRALSKTTTRIADATTAHIRITIGAGRVSVDSLGGGDAENQIAQLASPIVKPTANDILQIATGVVIT